MSGLGGKHRPRAHHAARPPFTVVPTTTVTVSPLEDDTGEIETFELRVPTIDQTVPGYGSLREPSPSRRVATAPAPLPRYRRDWPAIWGRAGLALSALGAIGAWVALFFADTADELLIAAAGISACWILLGAIAGWALGRD